VDILVRGYPIQPEVRYRDANDEIHIEKAPRPATTSASRSMSQGTRRTYSNGAEETLPSSPQAAFSRGLTPERTFLEEAGTASETRTTVSGRRMIKIYPYGVARNRLEQAAHRLGLSVQISRIATEADVVMTLRTYYRSRQAPLVDAESRGIPIYVLRANTINQMEQSLAEIFNLPQDSTSANYEDVANQTQSAIQAVLGGQHWVDLPPASASVRRVQHEMAREAELVSQSYGKEPNRRVRIFRE
jgi:predicted amino acid-binding ACT domain protein